MPDSGRIKDFFFLEKAIQYTASKITNMDNWNEFVYREGYLDETEDELL